MEAIDLVKDLVRKILIDVNQGIKTGVLGGFTKSERVETRASEYQGEMVVEFFVRPSDGAHKKMVKDGFVVHNGEDRVWKDERFLIRNVAGTEGQKPDELLTYMYTELIGKISSLGLVNMRNELRDAGMPETDSENVIVPGQGN